MMQKHLAERSAVNACAVAMCSTGFVTSLMCKLGMAHCQKRSDARAGRSMAVSALVVSDRQPGRTLLSSLCSCTPSSETRQMRRKSPVVASRSGLLPSLSGMNMIFVGGYGCWNVSFGSLLNFPVSSSTAHAGVRQD